MKDACKDPEIGALLHAYEIGALPEEDVERFEKHLLGCEFCFAEVSRFASRAELLRSDPQVQNELTGLAPEPRPAPPWAARLWRRLWPEGPIAFKPAVAYFLVMLLAYPAYLGFRQPDEGIRELQSITLLQTRSTTMPSLKLSSESDAIVAFHFDGAKPRQAYRVELSNSDGTVIIRDDAFRAFDDLEIGRLLLPRRLMETGTYHLTINDPNDTSALGQQEYQFGIE